MPLHTYECLFLLDSNKTAGNLDSARTHLHTILDKYGSEIIATRPWDDRRLAYPIKGHKKGQYYLIFFKCESLKMIEMEHDFRLSELILRHLVSHIDPKWEELMMEVAKDDHKLSYQSLREEAPEGGGDPAFEGIPDDMNSDGKPRRPRRSPDGEGKD